MLLMIFIMACTEETAEVDNLSRQEQHVTVRMQVPGMTATTTRADETINLNNITALAFGGKGENDNLLAVKTVNTFTDVSGNQGTFALTVPNDAKTIHFLANLPAEYSEGVSYVDYITNKIGQSQEDVITSLTTGVYWSLSYWGMATYDGSNNTLSTTLYRNMAMVEIVRKETSPFTQEQLSIAGLINASEFGTLVPYDGENYNYDKQYTLPNNLTYRDANEDLENPYGSWLYLFEHDNSGTAEGSLFVICKIAGDYYKVALVNDKGQPYDIIRNHRYVIYVDDLDEGAATFTDATTAPPVNFEVWMIRDAAFEIPSSTTVYRNGGASASLPITFTLPNGSSLTQLSISAAGFTVTSSNDSDKLTGSEGNYTYTGGSTVFTFTPTNEVAAGSHTITFRGEGNLLNPISREVGVKIDDTQLSVTQSATINMDKSENSTTLTLTKPGNITNLKVTASNNNAFTINGNAINGDYNISGSSNNETINYSIALRDEFNTPGEYTITFADSNNQQTVYATATITVVNTPKVTFSNAVDQTIYLSGGTPNNFQVGMNGVPNEGSVTLSISADDFIVEAAEGTLQGPTDEGVYTYTGGNTTFTFTPTNVGVKPISITGSGDNIKVNDTSFDVTVKESSMSVTPDAATINMDANPAVTSATLTLTKPANMQNVKLSINDGNGAKANRWFNIRIDNNDLWYDQNNDYFGDIQNGNTNVQVTLTMKDNTISSGTYTVRFADSNNQSTYVDATITVQNTPKLIYEYTNKTLYLLDSTGASNPTSLDVKVTVPDGSTLSELIISAPGFTIKQGTSEPIADNYTYIGGTSTTFTFIPTSTIVAGEKTITFSGTNTNLIVDKQIKVTVSGDRAPNEDVIWEGTPVELGWKNDNGDKRFLLTDERIKNNPSICIVIDVPNEPGNVQLQGYIPGYFRFTDLTKGETDKHVIINTKQNSAEPDGTLILEGAGVILKKIYIPSTSE